MKTFATVFLFLFVAVPWAAVMLLFKPWTR
jgi:hypothetical protein